MQAPGPGPDEDPRGGFERGGWAGPGYSDPGHGRRDGGKAMAQAQGRVRCLFGPADLRGTFTVGLAPAGRTTRIPRFSTRPRSTSRQPRWPSRCRGPTPPSSRAMLPRLWPGSRSSRARTSGYSAAGQLIQSLMRRKPHRPVCAPDPTRWCWDRGRRLFPDGSPYAALRLSGSVTTNHRRGDRDVPAGRSGCELACGPGDGVYGEGPIV